VESQNIKTGKIKHTNSSFFTMVAKGDDDNAAIVALYNAAPNLIAALALVERIRAGDAWLVERMTGAMNDCPDQEFFPSWVKARAALMALAKEASK
jgi:acyl-CoA hydrolase